MSLFEDNMNLNLEDLKCYINKYIEVINKFTKGVRCKNSIYSSIAFLYCKSKPATKEMGKKYLNHSTLKNTWEKI